MSIKSLMLITMITIVLSASPSSAGITGNTVIGMPDNIVAGSTYQVEYMFTTSDAMDVSIDFSATHTESNLGDWNVCYVLNNSVIVPYEPLPGQFTSGDISVNASDHNLIITFSSVPNLTPGKYAFKIDVIQVEDAPVEQASGRSSSRSSGFYITPAPTETPVNATETPTPMPVNETNTTEKHINVTEPAQEPDDTNLIAYGIVGVIVAALLIYLYNKRKK